MQLEASPPGVLWAGALGLCVLGPGPLSVAASAQSSWEPGHLGQGRQRTGASGAWGGIGWQAEPCQFPRPPKQPPGLGPR